ncbi:hypothetical protein CSB09_02370 [Candidatus Gracilibacteria bacterium]|nr:MAG: hypothetical protein CSB09_02370 [Candidatus Gracilibacteria bacterium]
MTEVGANKSKRKILKQVQDDRDRKDKKSPGSLHSLFPFTKGACEKSPYLHEYPISQSGL